MSTKAVLNNMLFGASLSLLLGLIVVCANYVNAASGPAGMPTDNFSAAAGQSTNTTFQLAKGPVGRSGGATLRPGGSSSGQDGGASDGQTGGSPPGLGMDSLRGAQVDPTDKG